MFIVFFCIKDRTKLITLSYALSKSTRAKREKREFVKMTRATSVVEEKGEGFENGKSVL